MNMLISPMAPNTGSTTRYIRLREVLKIVPMSASSVWRLTANRDFPAPVKLSARITAWNRDEVMAWLKSRHCK